MSEQNGTKVDIFSLFSDSKTVRLMDDRGHYTEILMLKPSWRLRMDAYELFEETRLKERQRLQASSQAPAMMEYIRYLSKAQLIDEILGERVATREQLLDLYPLPDEAQQTLEARTKLLDDWKIEQRAVFEAKSMDALVEEMSRIAIERRATLEAQRQMNFYQLAQVCLHPETKAKIFESPSALEQLPDVRIINQLVEAFVELTKIQSGRPETIRAAAEDSTFLEPGSSGKPLTDIQPSATGT